MMVTSATIETDRTMRIRRLRQLVRALDRRTPHFEREGEAAIARDAADLKHQAIERLRALGDIADEE
jgi:hypothetical protein